MALTFAEQALACLEEGEQEWEECFNCFPLMAGGGKWQIDGQEAWIFADNSVLIQKWHGWEIGIDAVRLGIPLLKDTRL